MSAINKEVGEAAVDVNSQLITTHGGLAAAIARVLSGEQKTEENSLKQERAEQVISKSRTPIKKKRPRLEGDSDEEGSDEDSPHPVRPQQSELVRLCHRAVQDYPKAEERRLQRSATRGVVQLFNAVSKHQKSIEDKLKEAGSSERKKHKILTNIDKGGFIDLLKTGNMSTKTPPTQSTEPSWHILRDDYLKSSKLQDWDQDREESGGDSGETSSDSD